MKEKKFYIPEPYNMYCKKITPKKVKYPFPIVMITGVAHTGNCYESTPDYRKGWTYFFVEQGFEVYVTDWPSIGKSGFVPFEIIDGDFMTSAFVELIKMIGKKVIILVHSMAGPYGWKIGELIGDKISNIIAIAPGEMGNIQENPKIVQRKDNIIKVKMDWGILSMNMNSPLKNDDDFITKKLIGESKLFPIDYIDQYKASLQLRHPVLTFERLNIDNSQLRIEDLSKYKNVQILIITGTHDKDHSKEKDYAIAEFFRQNDIDCDFIFLGDIGIIGNGHMMMLEKNSDIIAFVIYDYLKKTIKKEMRGGGFEPP